MTLNYKRQNLFMDNLSIGKIGKKNITPFYIYSYKKIRDNFFTFKKYFGEVNPIICFSVKSNSNPYLLSELGKLGSGADAPSSARSRRVWAGNLAGTEYEYFHRSRR